MRCLWCHKDVDDGWTMCPDCGGELDPDLTTGASAPTYRPAGAKPFDPFVIVSVRRMTASGPLVVLGAVVAFTDGDELLATFLPDGTGLAVRAARFRVPPHVRGDQTYVTRAALLDRLS